jgi:fructose-1,6-bisphosphatase/inositol monophosphatase family enzyme
MRELLNEAAEAVQTAITGLDDPSKSSRTGMGADGTPTQLIDQVAENAVLEVLERLGAPLNVLSEEHEYIDNGSEYTLVLDPIDGTFNATNGIPFFSTSLAVGKTRLSDIRYALVRDLVTGTVYYAEKDKGAFSNGTRLSTRNIDESVVFSVYIGAMAKDVSYRIAKLGRRGRNFGAASLEMCLVAQGSLDLYYLHTVESAKLRVMDVAAGSLIVREAGGEVLHPDGSVLDVPLDIKTRTDIMVIGDRKVLEVIS